MIIETPRALQKCLKPPIIKDGEITEETRKSEYFTDDIVKYSCNPGFHITGSDESRCTERTWLAAPQCTEDPCGPPPSVTNAHVLYKKNEYKHGEYAQYVCVNNYKITEEKPATCLEGKWWHVPTCVYISCSPPPEIENGVLTGKKKDQYASGDKVRYRCNKEYAFEKKTNDKSEAICEETQWKSIPVCRKIGERCGPAPVVQYGDYLGPKQNYYKSGYTMQYKCPNFYKTEGETSVRCENGVWGDPPVCLEPCTANAKDMKENNIDFKWIAGNKLYSEHDDDMEFRCINGFEISNQTHLRVKCKRGVILYPKCIKIGSCLLSQSTMKQQNIYLNRSSEISNWETVTFECYEKMVPENVLQATCVNGKLDYPKCLFAEKCKSAPEVQNGKLKGEQNQGGYDSGSTVEFECDPQHVLSGPISVKCERGQWSDLPQCLKPCKIFTKDLNARNVEFISPEDEHIYENGDEVDFKCKTGFKNINSGNPLKGECNDGKMKYPKCFQGSTCRLSQEILDEKNVELHTNENYDVYYGNGETITFKCKIGFHSTSELTGKCENQILTYPSCTFRESSV
ncbi:complement factor H-like [Pelobates fuscus]|uniref:complement factor H-like n=1 Tax=Pelobates fuscus TaxID=191477 RepID=UPI002FE46AB1